MVVEKRTARTDSIWVSEGLRVSSGNVVVMGDAVAVAVGVGVEAAVAAGKEMLSH